MNSEDIARNEGLEAAKKGLPMSVLEQTAYSRIGTERQRSAWLIGWRNGGGDILRRIVVTPKQKLLERRARLTEEIAEIDGLIERLESPRKKRSPGDCPGCDDMGDHRDDCILHGTGL